METNEKRTVYAVSFNPEFDYDDAKRFGDVVFMTKGYVIGMETEEILRIFKRYTENASKDDYLLLSGTTLLCSLATVEWVRAFDTVNFLFMSPIRDKEKQQTRYVYQLHHVSPQVQEN